MAGRFLDISVLGNDKLQRRLQKLDLHMQKKVFKAAAWAAAVPVLHRAIALAPVLTGKLRDSLRIRLAAKRRAGHGVRVETGTRKQLGISPEDTHFYPAVLEYKHESYMRRAADEKQAEALAVMAREIRRGINSV